jgi:glycosyltransferase involved in cell wall biosynthesis
MIVKNESANIDDSLVCFASFADEIIIVDTGSTDNTKELASRFTSKVYDFKWIDDFSAARNFALSKAGRTYQLWVDADDRITGENQDHIRSLKSYFDGRKAFYFKLENHHVDAPPSSCMQLRCVPITENVRFEGRVHEQIFPSAVRAGLELVTTDIAVRHLGYTTREVQMAKAKRNVAIMEKEKAEGRNDGALHFFLALTYAPLGKKEEASRSMEAALKQFEGEYHNHHLIPEGYLFLARLSLEMKEYGKCMCYLDRAGAFANGNPLQRFEMGIIYQWMGMHHKALESFREVFGKKHVPGLFPYKSPPGNSELLLHMAYSFYCIHDYQNALKSINSSALHEAEIGRSWEWLGTKAYLFENMSLAALAYETARRLGALESASWGRLASIYEFSGFPQKAQQCFLHAADEARI